MQPASGVPVSPNTGIPGWESDEEEELLGFYASQVPENGRIVEIGAEYGRSAGAFLTNSLPSVDILSIDLFPTDHYLVGDLLAVYEANLKEIGFFTADRYAPWRISSHDASLDTEHWNEEIDLLFIDGDHTYQGVKQDIEDWTPKIKKGGVVAFHDVAVDETSHPLHHEVRRAVEESMIAPDWKLEDQRDSLRIYRRG